MHGIDTFVPYFFTHVWGTRIVVILGYPGCDRLWTVSKDELSSLFYETPSSWGDCQNTPYSGFAKGPRFFNTVITFIFHHLSHYNTIIEPCLTITLSQSLVLDFCCPSKRISIDFPFHFILSLIDVYKDTATYDMLIFPSAITRILLLMLVCSMAPKLKSTMS